MTQVKKIFPEMRELEQRIAERVGSGGGLSKQEFETTRTDLQRLLPRLTEGEKNELHAWLSANHPSLVPLLNKPAATDYRSFAGPKLLRHPPGPFSPEVQAYLDILAGLDLKTRLDLNPAGEHDEGGGELTPEMVRAIVDKIGANRFPDFVQRMIINDNGLMFRMNQFGDTEITEQLLKTEAGAKLAWNGWLRSLPDDMQAHIKKVLKPHRRA